MKAYPLLHASALFSLLMVPSLQADPPVQAALTNFSKDKLKDGDMLFIKSTSERVEILKELTKSNLTHCGVAFRVQDKWMVYEGAGNYPPLDIDHWQERESGGQGKKKNPIYVRRLTNREQRLPAEKVTALKKRCEELHHTHYDFGFAWNNRDSDNKEYIYCSELLFKAFDEVIEVKLGALLPLKHYYEGKPSEEEKAIKQIMDKTLNSAKSKGCRGNKHYDPEEKAISPVEVFNSGELEAVTDN